MSKRIANCGILIALAMIFSYVEVLIPINFGIPGVKLGLANLVVVVGIYLLDSKDVLIISVTRIVLVGFLFGNLLSIAYSIAGGILSFIVMVLIKKINGFSIIGVSIAGGVTHNIGQIIVAIIIVENLALMVYLPVLLITGMITGMLIGILSIRILPIINKSNQEYID